MKVAILIYKRQILFSVKLRLIIKQVPTNQIKRLNNFITDNVFLSLIRIGVFLPRTDTIWIFKGRVPPKIKPALCIYIYMDNFHSHTDRHSQTTHPLFSTLN